MAFVLPTKHTIIRGITIRWHTHATLPQDCILGFLTICIFASPHLRIHILLCVPTERLIFVAVFVQGIETLYNGLFCLFVPQNCKMRNVQEFHLVPILPFSSRTWLCVFDTTPLQQFVEVIKIRDGMIYQSEVIEFHTHHWFQPYLNICFTHVKS